MKEPPLNLDYWASLYSIYTDYAEEYDHAMEHHSSFVERARTLWDWKGLNRTIPFDQIAPVLEDLDQTEYIDKPPEEALASLSEELREQGVVESNSHVTAAFLLHLLASKPDQYSAKFPIYDRRVWNAYVYLWRIRGDGDRLYNQASQSASQYGEFCRTFRETCPDGKAREYERALFMFGGFIMKLPPKDSPTPIATIDEKLEAQENALTSMYETAGYASVDPTGILESD